LFEIKPWIYKSKRGLLADIKPDKPIITLNKEHLSKTLIDRILEKAKKEKDNNFQSRINLPNVHIESKPKSQEKNPYPFRSAIIGGALTLFVSLLGYKSLSSHSGAANILKMK
jgi:hypothetical protein